MINDLIHVYRLDNGLDVYKKQNPAGGWTYYGESCSVLAVIYDSAVGTKEEFMAIAKDCYNLELKEVE